MLNPEGPGGRCVRMALDGTLCLFLSSPILTELRELSDKQVGLKYGIDRSRIERLIKALLTSAVFLDVVPAVYQHPIDDDDSCYVNLAIAAGANLIVSRDRHLLNLVNPAKPWSLPFREQFPHLRIMQPDEYLRHRGST